MEQRCRALAHELRTHPVGCRIEYHSSLDSTNEVLRRRMAAEAVPTGQVVLSSHQTKGRGRRGRSFFSPPNQGLYLSVLLRPVCLPEQLSMLTAWAGVAAAEAVESAFGLSPEIKWPNDLVVRGKKLGGILTELVLCPDTGTIDGVIVGIGINLTQAEADFGPELSPIATSLALEGVESPDPVVLTRSLLLALDEMSAAFPAAHFSYHSRFTRRCLTLGQPVQVMASGSVRAGVAAALLPDFSLLVRWPDGTEEAVSTGEVSVRGLYGYTS